MDSLMSKIYITYLKTKIKKFIVEVRLFEIKYLKTKTQNLEIYMKFSLKIGLLSLFFFFFLQGYNEMKMKIKE